MRTRKALRAGMLLISGIILVFSVLGFRKNIHIDILPESGVPVQISGTIPVAGKVVLKLSTVELRRK